MDIAPQDMNNSSIDMNLQIGKIIAACLLQFDLSPGRNDTGHILHRETTTPSIEENTMYTVNNKGSHILISFTGTMNEGILRSAVYNLAPLLDNENKNEIWSFDACVPTITYSKLFSIIHDGRSDTLGNRRQAKTAIVTSRAANSSLASIGTERPGMHPFSIRIFRNFRAAESWIIAPLQQSA